MRFVQRINVSSANRLSGWRGYVVALLAVLVAGMIRHALTGALGGGYAYIMFYPAVMLVGVFAGMLPGAVAVLLAAAWASVWILPGKGGVLDMSDIVSLGVFTVTGMLMSAVAGMYRRVDDKSAGLEKQEAALQKEIAERKHAEESLRDRALLSALRADIGIALISGETLPAVLQRCAEAMVKHLDAAFARIWTLNDAENVLDLQASAGLYTHLNGPHGRVKVGDFKIGRIAQSRQPLLTNDVLHDPNISDPEWARREGMVAFAGYPMLLEGSVLGVVAMFARHALSETAFHELAPISDGIAQWVKRRRAEEALRDSEDRFREMADNSPFMIWVTNPAAEATYLNQRWYEFTGQRPEMLLVSAGFKPFTRRTGRTQRRPS